MTKLFISFICLFWCGLAIAQNKFDSLKFSFHIHPQFLLINGIKADVEYKLFPNLHIYAGGQHYSGLTNRNGNKSVTDVSATTTYDQTKRANDEINGSGFNIGAKYYFINTSREHFFAGSEFSYNQYNFKLNDYGYFPYQDDGLTFYEFRLGQYAAQGNQSTGSFYLGVTGNEGRFVVNLWVGASYIYTNTDSKLKELREFNKLYWDYAYKGIAPLLGFKVGFLLF